MWASGEALRPRRHCTPTHPPTKTRFPQAALLTLAVAANLTANLWLGAATFAPENRTWEASGASPANTTDDWWWQQDPSSYYDPKLNGGKARRGGGAGVRHMRLRGLLMRGSAARRHTPAGC